MNAQRVLITGGGSGIGRAMAEAFAADGARVWVTDAKALSALPSDWQCSSMDVADETAVAALFKSIVGQWGGLDVLCANAGIAGPTQAIEDIELPDWRRCVSVNLEGAFLAAKYTAPLMKKKRAGSMIFTASTAGIYGYPGRAPYAAAKGMTRDQLYQGYAAGTSMNSWVTGADIANMAVFLASEQARLVSGQVIAVDGHTENPNPKI